MTLWQKIETAVFLAAVIALTGCGPLTPAQHAEINRVECEVHALEPLALQDADYAVREIDAGGLSIDLLVTVVGEVKTNVDAIKTAFKECRAEFPGGAALAPLD